MCNGQLSFGESLRIATDTLYPVVVLALATVGDPLRLDLPPLLSAVGQVPQAETLRVMSAVYFQAELEQAGVIAVAELLAESRRTLDVQSVRVSRKLEEFAERSRHHWYDRSSRNVTFARLFGIGAVANQHEGTVNRDFQQRLAMLCLALTNYQRDYRWGQTPGATREAALREAARAMLLNLGPRQYGNLPAAARTIQEQLHVAIDVLNDPDLTALFQGRSMWDVLRAILGDAAPDLGRLVTRGQAGMRLLQWLASVIAALQDSASTRPLLPAGAPVYVWAAAWLQATGMEAVATRPITARR
jgi:hypothetical protein